MDKGPPPPGGDVDRSPAALAFFWTTASIATIIVVLRFVGRRMIRSIGWDDWMMLVTLLLYIISAAFKSKLAAVGGNRHSYYLTPDQTTQALFWNFTSQPWVVLGFATGKLSVGLLVLRILGTTTHTFWRKLILWFLMSTALIFSIVNIILTFVQCSPVSALWNPGMIASGQARCLNPAAQAKFAVFLSAWNILCDVVLAVLPATIIYKLNLSLKKKLGLCVLLGLGMAAAVCAIVKTTYVLSLSARSDTTWQAYDLYVWSGAELFVIIVCGSIPPLKPIVDTLRGKPRSSRGSSYPHHSGSSSKRAGAMKKGSAGSSGSSSDQRQILGRAGGPQGLSDLSFFEDGKLEAAPYEVAIEGGSNTKHGHRSSKDRIGIALSNVSRSLS